MTENTPIANAMEGTTETFYIRTPEGEHIPFIRITVESTESVPDSITDYLQDTMAAMRATVAELLR